MSPPSESACSVGVRPFDSPLGRHGPNGRPGPSDAVLLESWSRCRGLSGPGRTRDGHCGHRDGAVGLRACLSATPPTRAGGSVRVFASSTRARFPSGGSARYGADWQGLPARGRARAVTPLLGPLAGRPGSSGLDYVSRVSCPISTLGGSLAQAARYRPSGSGWAGTRSVTVGCTGSQCC